MPAPTLQQFLADYPEFMDESVYPPDTVMHWLEVADLMLTMRWDDCYVAPNTANASKTMRYIGIELFAAHNVAIAGRNIQAAANGGGPGVATSTGVGVVAAKAVDEVSMSYDSQSSIELGAGHWNLTTYGSQFVRMARMVGAAPLQIGAGCNILDPRVPVPSPDPPWFGVIVDLGMGEW